MEQTKLVIFFTCENNAVRLIKYTKFTFCKQKQYMKEYINKHYKYNCKTLKELNTEFMQWLQYSKFDAAAGWLMDCRFDREINLESMAPTAIYHAGGHDISDKINQHLTLRATRNQFGNGTRFYNQAEHITGQHEAEVPSYSFNSHFKKLI